MTGSYPESSRFCSSTSGFIGSGYHFSASVIIPHSLPDTLLGPLEEFRSCAPHRITAWWLRGSGIDLAGKMKRDAAPGDGLLYSTSTTLKNQDVD